MGFYMRSPVYTPNDPVKSVKQLHSWVYQLNENLKFMFSNLDSDNFTDEFSKLFSSMSLEKITLDIEKLQKDVGEISKEGEWTSLIVTGLTPHADENAPSYLNAGHGVFLSGSGALLETLPSGGRRTIAVLSEENRPRKTQSQAIFAGDMRAELEALSTGEIVLINSDGNPIEEGALIPLSMFFGL